MQLFCFKFCHFWTKKEVRETPSFEIPQKVEEIKIPPPSKKLPPKHVLLEYVSPQEFAFSKPIINYLLINVKVETIKKLQQCCRYFYLKFHYNIIDNLSIASYFHKYICTNFDTRIQDSVIKLLKNDIYLNKSLFISNCNPVEIYPKIIKCDIYKLRIAFCENFSINDFAFLTKSRNLGHVEISGYLYYPDKTTKVSLEDIFSLIPNAFHFRNVPCIITSNTMQKINLTKRNVKLSFLALRVDSELLDVHLFNDYINKMFVFDDTPHNKLYIHLSGMENVLRPLYNLFKTWRPKSSLEHIFDGLFWLLIY